MNTLADIVLLLSLAALIVGLIKPSVFERYTHGKSARKKIGLVFGVAIIVALVVLAANGSKTMPKPVSSTTQTHNAPAQPAKPVTTANNQPKLQGIGETDAVWNSTHTADSQFKAGSAYDPTPNSIYGDATNSKNTDKYVGAVHQYGVVADYNISLNQGLSQDKAKAIAMAEMPTDATVLNSATNPNGCYIITLHSNLLASSLAQNDSQNQGGIIIELDTVSSNSLDYSPSNVNFMDIRLANYPSGTSAPSCTA